MKDNYAILGQDRYATNYKLSHYLMGGWQVSDLRYSYDSTDIQIETTSLRRMLGSLGKHVIKQLPKAD